jgi:nucleoside-triphosphatase THEP1
MPLSLGGFFTWKGDGMDSNVYLQPAQSGTKDEAHRIALYNPDGGGMIIDIGVFERNGVEIIKGSTGADLIIMDELGFMESKALTFRQAVLDTLTGNIPILGVLRLGDIPWHTEIKSNPMVKLIEVNAENRDSLPQELADLIRRKA